MKEKFSVAYIMAESTKLSMNSSPKGFTFLWQRKNNGQKPLYNGHHKVNLPTDARRIDLPLAIKSIGKEQLQS